MDSVYIFASSLCVCLVLCAVVKMFAPCGATSKIISVVMGIFILCCLTSPIYNFVKSVNFSDVQVVLDDKSQKLTEEYDKEVLAQTTQYINEYAKGLVESLQVEVNNIKTVVGISDTKGIYIREVSIYIDKINIDKSNEITGVITESLGCKPRIVTE